LKVFIFYSPKILIGWNLSVYGVDVKDVGVNRINLDFIAKDCGGPQMQKEGGHQEMSPVGLLQEPKRLYIPNRPAMGTTKISTEYYSF